jgi:hypothetical protein
LTGAGTSVGADFILFAGRDASVTIAKRREEQLRIIEKLPQDISWQVLVAIADF